MNINASRRGFLRGLAGTSLFAIGGCKCPFGNTQKIKLAVVGVMGKGYTDWTTMYRSGLVEVVALCDCDYRTRESAQLQLVKNGIDLDLSRIPFYTDYRRLLDDCGVLGVEAMTVSTPDHAHAAIAIGAMKQGIHVYVQKPLVRTLWELDYFRQTAIDNGVITQMGNQGSALDSMRRCTEVLQSGLIGEIKEAHVWTNRPVWPQGIKAAEATKGAADPVQSGLNWDTWLNVAAKRNFKGAYKPGTKGYDPWNLCTNVYHAFSWRGFYDFGCGAFGDMACHTMNLAFRGLELGAVKSAECIKIDEFNDIAFPMKSIVKMVYAERESKVRPGVKLPECELYWYDGELRPEALIMPKVVKTLGKVPNTGCYIIGSKGVVVMVDDYGGKCLLALNDEDKLIDMFEHEAAKQVPRSIPFRADATNKMEKGPGAAAISADGHYVEFLQAIRGEGPVFEDTHSRCFSDIEFSIPIMEGILVGVTAQRVPGKLNWCSCQQKFDVAAANELIRPYIRKGFEF